MRATEEIHPNVRFLLPMRQPYPAFADAA